jgi:PAS domain S-box-containing protein
MSDNKLQILHVEDNFETCQLVKRLLTRSNSMVKCTTAMTLSKAIEFLENSHFDSVLLDLSLPDSDGLDTIDGIIETGGKTPIIVLTGTDDPDMRSAALEKGVSDYIIKGDEAWECLITRIWRVIQHERDEYYVPEVKHNLKTSFSKLPIPIVCLSENGHVIYINPKAEKLWEISARTVLGRSFLQTFISSRERFSVYLCLRQSLAGGSPDDITSTLLKPDGKKRLLLWSFDCMFTSEWGTNLIIASVRDITEIPLFKQSFILKRNMQYSNNFSKAAERILQSLQQIISKIEKLKRYTTDDINKVGNAYHNGDYEGVSCLPTAEAMDIERIILSLISNKEALLRV